MAYQEIEGFADLELEVEAHLDQIHMTLRQILELAPDTTLKLNRPAGDNIDLLVGGNVLCSGEIVIVNEMLSVRITDFREER
ncbi:MAG TPA: FliM/FliN family flagellar motor C-terminal domain-containing protein [Bryobacteraceae bacterium]|nr:FliM/FliN family flagellar motor C-terminal domain-containing protein [Bryobacteraceae bacterium]